MILGWGLFNLVEGIIDHHILKIHHVIQLADNHLLYDLAFLASGLLLIIVGIIIIRAGRTDGVVRIERSN